MQRVLVTFRRAACPRNNISKAIVSWTAMSAAVPMTYHECIFFARRPVKPLKDGTRCRPTGHRWRFESLQTHSLSDFFLRSFTLRRYILLLKVKDTSHFEEKRSCDAHHLRTTRQAGLGKPSTAQALRVCPSQKSPAATTTSTRLTTLITRCFQLSHPILSLLHNVHFRRSRWSSGHRQAKPVCFAYHQSLSPSRSPCLSNGSCC